MIAEAAWAEDFCRELGVSWLISYRQNSGYSEQRRVVIAATEGVKKAASGSDANYHRLPGESPKRRF